MLNTLQEMLAKYLTKTQQQVVNLRVYRLDYSEEGDDCFGDMPSKRIPVRKEHTVSAVQTSTLADGGFITTLWYADDRQILVIKDANNQQLDITAYTTDTAKPTQRLYQLKSLRKPELPLTLTVQEEVHGYQESRSVTIRVDMFIKQADKEAQLQAALARLLAKILEVGTGTIPFGNRQAHSRTTKVPMILFSLHQPRLRLDGFSCEDDLSVKAHLILSGKLEMSLYLPGELENVSQIRVVDVRAGRQLLTNQIFKG